MQPDPNLVKEVFLAALEQSDAAARRLYLDNACRDEPELRRAVEKLLLSHARATEFLAVDALGNPPAVAGAEALGLVIGRYRILRLIGEGGFGSVYLAEQREPVARQVALKILKPGLDTRQVVARFEAERQALALMDHPNIAKVLDGGTTESGRPYFVMELVEGTPLTEYCDQHQLTTTQRLDLFLQVCQAVQHAHQKGIIHRDLKPSNILVTEQTGPPVPKVIDFGVVKGLGQKLTDKTLVTLEHQFLGTPVYCSPEQVDPTAADVDTRADLYSLGVVLFELLTGRTPFDPEVLRQAGWNEVVRILREEDPPRPSTRLTTLGKKDLDTVARLRGAEPAKLPSQLRGDLDWIIMKALEKDRNRRYASASTLALDLQRHLNHEPVEAAAPSWAYRTGKFIRRHRLGVVAGCAISATLILGTAVSLWQADRASWLAQEEIKQRKKAEQISVALSNQTLIAEQRAVDLMWQVYDADMNLAQQDINRGSIRTARIRLQKYLPGETETDLRGFEWYYHWQSSESKALRSRQGVGAPFAVVSNDTAVACGSDKFVVLCSLPELRTIRRLPAANRVLSLGFSTDERYLAVGSDLEGGVYMNGTTNGLVEIWDTVDWKIVARLSAPAPRVTFSPKGNWLAIGTRGHYLGELGGTVLVWDFLNSSSPPKPMGIAGGRCTFSADGKYLATGAGLSSVRVWETDSWRLVWQAPLRDRLMDLRFSPDDEVLATAHWDNEVILWNAREGTPLAHLSVGNGAIYSLAFDVDGQRLWAGSGDRSVYEYNLKTRLLRHAFDTENTVTGLAFIRGENLLLTDYWGNTLAWPAELADRNDTLTHVARYEFSPDGRWLLTQHTNRTISLHPANSTRVIRVLPDLVPNGQDGTNQVAEGLRGFSEDSQQFATVQWVTNKGYQAIRWWRVDTMQLAKEIPLEQLPEKQGGGILSPNGRWFLINLLGEPRGRLAVMNALTGRFSHQINAHSYSLYSIKFSPDSQRLATTSFDKTYAVWEVATGRELMRVKDTAQPTGCAFSADGQWLAVGSWDRPPEVREVPSGRLYKKFIPDGTGCVGIGISPDGRTLVTGSDDRTARLWNMTTGRQVGVLNHGNSAWGVQFSPDNQILATWEKGGVFRLWRAATTDWMSLKRTVEQGGAIPCLLALPKWFRENLDAAAQAKLTLIKTNSTWKYSTDANLFNLPWQEPAFDDRDWRGGATPLGYGETWLATSIAPTNTDIHMLMTRLDFVIEDSSKISPLLLRVLWDDGMAIYLNGKEILRENLPEGELDSETWAIAAVGPNNRTKEGVYYDYYLEPKNLRPGRNKIAVAVFQCDSKTSDLSFGLEMIQLPPEFSEWARKYWPQLAKIKSAVPPK